MHLTDSRFIEHSISQIAEDVRAAGRTLREMASYLEVYSRQFEEYENRLKDAFEYQLEALGRRMPVLLDLLGMNDTRESFLVSWEEFSDNLGATEAEIDEYGHYLVSKPFQLLSDITQVLAGSADSRQKDERLTANLETLEYVLRSIPQILNGHGIVPNREADIQRALHHHLEYTFPDYNRTVRLPKGLKSFEPDGAISSLHALIEVKFVDSKKGATTALSAVKEDLSGYGGSRDWTRFYSLLYQTGAFVTEARFDRSLRLSGNAGSWKAIVVTGSGARSARSVQAGTSEKTGA